ncbi:MAG TPA: LptA/OstA family protein [Bacteriovoracaceae bacterium]|nr:LptA/OstA family protein [Bacteriovoracaceae bacterium]
MKIRDPRSIIIILVYAAANAAILLLSFSQIAPEVTTVNAGKAIAPENTIIQDMDYFTLKKGVPEISLSAEEMISRGETWAEFKLPKGVYNYQQKKESIRYQAMHGQYEKDSGLLVLTDKVKVTSSDSEYYADKVHYYFDKDLVLGNGNVKFTGEDLKSKDNVIVESDKMEAHPEQKLGTFTGRVRGSMSRQKKFEGKTDFTSQLLRLTGAESLAHLEGDVWMKRDSYVITAGKADMYLENYNKSLKYFVLNDDVKVTEKLVTPEGVVHRKAFSERLEGFGREEKMVLSGAPRVETGSDVIKGYRITIRENVDLIEVDDAMSDVKVKREEKSKN